MADLMRYEDSGYIRKATEEETERSIAAAQIDGGAGAITVTIEGEDVTCYVVSEGEDEERAEGVWDNTVETNGYTVSVSDGVETYAMNTGMTLREAAEDFAGDYDHNGEEGTVRCTATDLRIGEAHDFSFDETGEVEW